MPLQDISGIKCFVALGGERVRVENDKRVL